MAGETAHDLSTVNLQADDKAKSDSRVENTASVTSSSPTLGAINMADRKIPQMSDFFKKSIVTNEERQAYHDFGWLTGNLTSTFPKVDAATVHDSTILCFESYLITGLGLLPSKFLAAIMNFLSCELVHFNPNSIATLSCFTMLCECWLGIVLDTILFWFHYSSAWYDKMVYVRIGLSLHRHHQKEYIKVVFKSY
jgi:hypothetical protein